MIGDLGHKSSHRRGSTIMQLRTSLTDCGLWAKASRTMHSRAGHFDRTMLCFVLGFEALLFWSLDKRELARYLALNFDQTAYLKSKVTAGIAGVSAALFVVALAAGATSKLRGTEFSRSELLVASSEVVVRQLPCNWFEWSPAL